MAAPMRPISQPKPKLFSEALNLYVWPTMIHPTRKNNAMATIQNCEVRMTDHAPTSRAKIPSRVSGAVRVEVISHSICKRVEMWDQPGVGAIMGRRGHLHA